MFAAGSTFTAAAIVPTAKCCKAAEKASEEWGCWQNVTTILRARGGRGSNRLLDPVCPAAHPLGAWRTTIQLLEMSVVVD
jgi:hypothetical protein